MLAQHCAEAGLAEKAVGYWLKAAEQAIARGAITEAVTQLRKGFALLSDVSDGVACQEQELMCEAVNATKLRLNGANFCRARLCPLCKRRSLKLRYQLGRVLNVMFSQIACGCCC
jgi:hypothetical protein